MICTIQHFLRSNGEIRSLTPDLGIKVIQSVLYPDLYLFKYDTINSPRNHPLVNNARGLILDRSNNWSIVAWPFNRFFNYGEGCADIVNWNTAKVQTKEDGSLVFLYYYDNKWNVATSGRPNALGNVHFRFDITFSELFWRIFNQMELMLPTIKHSTHMFELCSHLNRVVVQHDTEKLVYLSSRNLIDGQEYDDDEFIHIKVKSYPLQSIEDVLASFDVMDPLNQEGYVIVDSQYRRIKVKHASYVAIHHLKDGFRVRRLVEMVRLKHSKEFLYYFPEYMKDFNKVQTLYDSTIIEIDHEYDKIKHIDLQKEFALEALKTRYPSVLFSKRLSGEPTKFILNKMHIKMLMQTLNIDDEFLTLNK